MTDEDKTLVARLKQSASFHRSESRLIDARLEDQAAARLTALIALNADLKATADEIDEINTALIAEQDELRAKGERMDGGVGAVR
jgi:hypothetical protein